MKYICSNCESEFLKWSGKCPSCNEWGTLEEVEEVATTSKGSNKAADYKTIGTYRTTSSSKVANNNRLGTGFSELDRVLGGGIVEGEIILISGEPGVGKSTILIQVAKNLILKGKKVLYVCGEESPSQIYSRLERISKGKKTKDFENLFVTTSVDVDEVANSIEGGSFDLVIVDSIQSISSSSSKSFAGSMSQIRIAGSILTRVSKTTGTPVILVGQINKMGDVAGPKILEHIVDCVLYIEGEKFNQYRIVRGMKNRYGSTNEIGVFEMSSSGLSEVGNPSLLFLEKSEKVTGSAIAAVLQGSRVVFLEVQALVAPRSEDGFTGPLKRVANGIKKQRLDMICAVLTKKGGCFLGNSDVYVNVVGGLNISDPGLDLAICAAIKSSVKEKVLEKDTIYFGEVGLTGEVRGSWGLESILEESKRIGYNKVVVGRTTIKKDVGVEVKKVYNINTL